jgi:hypothetical protein
MKFQQWLNRQQDREDAIGRLATALADIDAKKYPYSRRRKPDEHRKWATIVTRLGSQVHVRSFNRAWSEFLKAKARSEKQEGVTS